MTSPQLKAVVHYIVFVETPLGKIARVGYTGYPERLYKDLRDPSSHPEMVEWELSNYREEEFRVCILDYSLRRHARRIKLSLIQVLKDNGWRLTQKAGRIVVRRPLENYTHNALQINELTSDNFGYCTTEVVKDKYAYYKKYMPDSVLPNHELLLKGIE